MHLSGLEPETAVPKTAVISISPQVHLFAGCFPAPKIYNIFKNKSKVAQSKNNAILYGIQHMKMRV